MEPRSIPPHLETPEVLLFLPQLMANIRAMQQRADAAGLALRPHVKTHKSLEIARLQLQAGAKGLTAAKAGEALVFMEAGLGPVLTAYPLLDPVRLRRLCATARNSGAELSCLVDSALGVERLDQAAAASGLTVPVSIKVDVGLRRCGVLADSPALTDLARLVLRAPALRLQGLVSHAGHAYAARDAAEVRGIAETERRLMLLAAGRLAELGCTGLRLSVGSTPTALAAENFTGLHELRPGNYVFLDRTPLRLGLAPARHAALVVLASVVSKNTDFLILDAGSKVLGLDKAPHGLEPEGGGDFGFGLLDWFEQPAAPRLDRPRTVSRLSEEHGLVARAGCPDFDPPLGARVLITPNHSCVVANLAQRYCVLHPERPPQFWPVDARGQVR